MEQHENSSPQGQRTYEPVLEKFRIQKGKNVLKIGSKVLDEVRQKALPSA